MIQRTLKITAFFRSKFFVLKIKVKIFSLYKITKTNKLQEQKNKILNLNFSAFHQTDFAEGKESSSCSGHF